MYNFNGREILASYSDESIFLFDSTDEVFGNYLHKYQGHALVHNGNFPYNFLLIFFH